MNTESLIKNIHKFESDIEGLNSSLESIKTQNNNFLYEQKDISLVGQGVPTDVEMLMKKDFSNNKREYALGVEVNADGSSGTASGSSGASGHKVGMYSSICTGTTGTPYIWAFNTLTQVDSGLVNKTIAQGFELDMNNNQADWYNDYPQNWSNGLMVGLNITSGGKYSITAGIRIGGSKTMLNAPAQSIILENSLRSGVLFKGQHTVGLNFRGCIITDTPLLLDQNQRIKGVDSSGNNVRIINITGDVVELGTGGSGLRIVNKANTTILSIDENGALFNLGKKIIPTLAGTTTEKPTTGIIGQMFFDLTKGIPLFWNGAGWIKSDGNLPT